MTDNLPLKRFRVIDMTHARAGPTCVRLLSDWGADVIMVEPPLESGKNRVGSTGKRHGFDFQNLHRNKRAISINLKTEEGKEIFFKLIKDADVLVENFRSVVKHKLGIDYDTVKKINPRLVYASISGFGQTGPYAERHGVDQIAQGMGGLMSVTGNPEDGPMRVGIPITDLCSGMFLAHAVLMALLDREVTGKGQWVHTSLLETMISMLDLQAARYLINGEVPKANGNYHPTGVPVGRYKTKDGHIVMSASSTRFPRLCKAIDREDLIDHPDYASVDKRAENREALNAIIEEEFSNFTSAEITDMLIEAGVPCGPVNNIEQVFADPQVQHLKMARTQEHPELGSFNVVGTPINFSNVDRPVTCFRHTPEASEHTDDVLADLGYDATTISKLREKNVI
ncbi:MAG: CaiB/BaiF CoA transferase family protein [Rhodospirillales bacterium]|jgi:crotonobetainyl-CoA:carnitine CoA-transferase CaiB-like acyl-CoA transferase